MAPLMALHGKPPPDERSQRLIRWSAIRDRLMRRVRRSAVQATADRRSASMAVLLPAPSHPDEDQREGDEVNSASDVDSDDSLSWMGQPPSALAIAAAARSGPGTLPCVVGSENAGVSVFGIPTHLMPAGHVIEVLPRILSVIDVLQRILSARRLLLLILRPKVVRLCFLHVDLPAKPTTLSYVQALKRTVRVDFLHSVSHRHFLVRLHPRGV